MQLTGASTAWRDSQPLKLYCVPCDERHGTLPANIQLTEWSKPMKNVFDICWRPTFPMRIARRLHDPTRSFQLANRAILSGYEKLRAAWPRFALLRCKLRVKIGDEPFMHCLRQSGNHTRGKAARLHA